MRTDADDDFTRFGGRALVPKNTSRTLAYHSMFGNARIVDDKMLAVLEASRDGTSLTALQEQVNLAAVRQLIDVRCLVPLGHDEASEVDDVLEQRAKALGSGTSRHQTRGSAAERELMAAADLLASTTPHETAHIAL